MSAPVPALPVNLETIVAKFERIDHPKRRYEYLLGFAQRLPPLSPQFKQPQYKVVGCISQVYLYAQAVEGHVAFQGDADALIPKGLLGLLVAGLNGLPPAEIGALSPDFIQRTGLNLSLTPSRSNGFYNIFCALQRQAIALAQPAPPAD
ncbi:SufE family protein [Lyngbya confervoides]|uniref:SufE family protein n=1 Tax=Lyngbya confervoides BDU141951 TaxID=1574623 RepID=A0ABD4T486_9CYAN|nr:SufE family protein [Lyngbya confervoides]MCM1983631.1 SufE family protein [Lyngbya confervoides BDU141951]